MTAPRDRTYFATLVDFAEVRCDPVVRFEVPGFRRGEHAQVLPGLTGRIAGWTRDRRHTVVSVALLDLLTWIGQGGPERAPPESLAAIRHHRPERPPWRIQHRPSP